MTQKALCCQYASSSLQRFFLYYMVGFTIYTLVSHLESMKEVLLKKSLPSIYGLINRRNNMICEKRE